VPFSGNIRYQPIFSLENRVKEVFLIAKTGVNPPLISSYSYLYEDSTEALRAAMTTRSKDATLTFSKAFALSEVDRPLPAGTYRVVVDEEDIPGLSFLALRRVATMLQVPALSAPGRPIEMFLVNPDELAAALEADSVAA
jgi:hypothetical protein